MRYYVWFLQIRSHMSGRNESNAIIIDSDEEAEVIDLQETVNQEDATCISASG